MLGKINNKMFNIFLVISIVLSGGFFYFSPVFAQLDSGAVSSGALLTTPQNIIKNFKITKLYPTLARMEWESNVKDNFYVAYSKDEISSDSEFQTIDAKFAGISSVGLYKYEAVLDNLDPDSLYYFKIYTKNADEIKFYDLWFNYLKYFATPSSELDTTPRIAYWWGKVNQYTENGVWKSDPDGVSGANINKFIYCKKWYPNTIEVEEYKYETIIDWKERGNKNSHTGTFMTYKCVQGESGKDADGEDGNSGPSVDVSKKPDFIVSNIRIVPYFKVIVPEPMKGKFEESEKSASPAVLGVNSKDDLSKLKKTYQLFVVIKNIGYPTEPKELKIKVKDITGDREYEREFRGGVYMPGVPYVVRMDKFTPISDKHTLEAIVDADNEFDEISEDNNALTKDFEFDVQVVPLSNYKEKPDELDDKDLEENDDKNAVKDRIKVLPFDNTAITNALKKQIEALKNINEKLMDRINKLKEKIKKLNIKISNLEKKVIEKEKKLTQKINEKLTERLKGRILLQVEENGEAWYIDPETSQRFYLKDGNSAYNLLRIFGLGIKTEDLEKIPVALDKYEGADTDKDGLPDGLEEALGTDPKDEDSDEDGLTDREELEKGYNPLGSGQMNTDESLAERLEGKILLQVDRRGEAWYVYNGQRYYLKDGKFAYDLMRKLSLGIKNSDIRQIPVGELE